MCGAAAGQLPAEPSAQSADPLPLPEMMEYLRLLKELEASDYELSSLQQRLKGKYGFAATPKAMPEVCGIPRLVFAVVKRTVIAALCCGAAGVIAGLILSIFTDITLNQSLAAGLLAGALLGGARELRRRWRRRRAEQKACRETEEENRLRVIVWNETSRSLNQAEQKRAEKKRLLDQMYSYGYLYPKYRGLVPVSTLYEYLASGRCFSLTGHAGAYNLYESERRMGIIIDQLEVVLNKLDTVAAGQWMLAEEIRETREHVGQYLEEIQQNTRQIADQAAAIARNTAQAAFWQRSTAINTMISAWCNSQ